jgi:hypothetical protein
MYMNFIFLFLRCLTCVLRAPGVESVHGVQTCCGAHPAFCLMGTGPLSRWYSCQGVMSTTDRRPAPMLRMSGAVPLLPVYDFQGLTRVDCTFYQYCRCRVCNSLHLNESPPWLDCILLYVAVNETQHPGGLLCSNFCNKLWRFCSYKSWSFSSRHARLPSFLGPFLFILPRALYYGANVDNYFSPFFCTCMYACMYVCMYVYIYMCIYL